MLFVNQLSVTFKTYLGNIQAIRSISLAVKRGESVAVVGESGCGKSAMAHAILRLLPRSAEVCGEILFDDEDLLKMSKKRMQQIRREKIGIIFQDPLTALNPTMRIGKQIQEAGASYEEALHLLDLVEIPMAKARMTHFPHELSGGMRQRIMTAIALAGNPDILIADEPTTALDVINQAQMLALIKKIQRERDMGLILITHDLGIVAGNCDRVIVMYGGEIVESSSVEQAFATPSHPYTEALLQSIPRIDRDRRVALTPIVGSPPDPLTSFPGCTFCPRCPQAMNICQLKKPSLEKIGEQTAACWRHHAK